jgi:hypothetical protein
MIRHTMPEVILDNRNNSPVNMFGLPVQTLDGDKLAGQSVNPSKNRGYDFRRSFISSIVIVKSR